MNCQSRQKNVKAVQQSIDTERTKRRGTAEVAKNNVKLKEHEKALVQGIHYAIGDSKTLSLIITQKMTK